MRKIATFVIAGTACSIASAQSSLDIERAYAAELSADAANRSSLLQGSGEGSGFSLTSGDGASTLNINAFFQFRYVADFRDDNALHMDSTNGVSTVGQNDFATGFEIPRARMDFSGNVAQDNITYRISGDFGEQNDRTGSNQFNLTWAYGQYAFESADGLFLRFGQFKAPLLWEELVDPEFQLAGDRSVTNSFFNQGYTQGLMFGYEAESWRGYFSVNDGLRSAGTNYNGAGESDIGLTARAEFKFAGDWAQFTDFNSWQNSDFAAKAGAAIHWESYGDTAPTTGSGGSPVLINPGMVGGDLLIYTVDASVEGNGWNLFGSFIGSSTDGDAAGSSSVEDFGLVVQGGVFVTEQFELFGRWDAIFLDSQRTSNVAGYDNDMHFLTFGVNYYMIPESHAVKASLELLWALNENTNLMANGVGGGVGILPGSGGGYSSTSFLGQDDSGELALRAQIGVLF